LKSWIDARIRGKLAASNNSQELIQAVLAADQEQRRLAPARWGTVLTCLAAGLALIEAFSWKLSAGALAILVGATGLGNLAFFAMAQWLRSRGTRDRGSDN
jgi:hypothetical protein